jgi:tRNA1(Val) A37 N6-methylase TrmN6
MLKLAKVTKNDVIYDLGSGDGRIPITAAKTYGRAAWASTSIPSGSARRTRT